jgi:hypothetical protein
VSCCRTNYCTRKFLADGPEVRRELRIGGKTLTSRFSCREIIASKESVSSTRARAILCSIGLLFGFRLEPSRLLRTACYAFHFTRVLWRRAGSRLLGQEVHLIAQNGKFAIRKVTELAIVATKKNTMQQEAARSDGSLYVGASQTRLHHVHVHNQNFKPAAPKRRQDHQQKEV